MSKKITITIDMGGDCGCGGDTEVEVLDPISDHAADNHPVAEHEMIEHEADDDF